MKAVISFLLLGILFVQPVAADIKSEIGKIDKAMLNACKTARMNAGRSKKNLVDGFLRILTNLETQYKNSGNTDAVLACRKTRAKYDPGAPTINQPTKIPDRLRVLVSDLEKQLGKIDRKMAKDISEAKSHRARKLLAIQRGLVKRGEKEDSKLVIAALKSPPKIPDDYQPAAQARTIIPGDFVYLTYDRPRKRWVQKDNQGVSKTVAQKTTTLHYQDGKHGLLKVLWPNVLEEGDRFSFEVQGALSVEAVDLNGADANARTSVAAPNEFANFEIVREKERISFFSNNKLLKTFYASGKLRGDAARNELVDTQLRAAFTIKKGEKASFRNAKIIRP